MPNSWTDDVDKGYERIREGNRATLISNKRLGSIVLKLAVIEFFRYLQPLLIFILATLHVKTHSLISILLIFSLRFTVLIGGFKIWKSIQKEYEENPTENAADVASMRKLAIIVYVFITESFLILCSILIAIYAY
jgi:uncharacterized protein YneF (UPF0154 family)